MKSSLQLSSGGILRWPRRPACVKEGNVKYWMFLDRGSPANKWSCKTWSHCPHRWSARKKSSCGGLSLKKRTNFPFPSLTASWKMALMSLVWPFPKRPGEICTEPTGWWSIDHAWHGKRPQHVPHSCKLHACVCSMSHMVAQCCACPT